MEKIVYLIKNLDCAHCGGKIQEELEKLPFVHELSLNFLNKKIYLTVKDDVVVKKEEIVKIFNEISDRIEPGTIIEEELKDTEIEIDKPLVKVIYSIKNLDCAHCASEIEEELNRLPFVHELFLNFISKKITLILKRDCEISMKEIKRLISEIANKIEPGVVIEEFIEVNTSSTPLFFEESIDENSVNHKDPEIMTHDHHVSSNMKLLRTYGLFIAGLLIFAFSLMTPTKNLEGKEIVSKTIGLITAYLLIGGDILLKSFKKIRSKDFLDENFLMSIATIGAIGIKDYSEAVAVMIFYKVGEFFQDRAVNNTKNSIKSLLALKPLVSFKKLENGEVVKVAPENLRVKDIIIVKKGETFPVDCKLISSATSIDTSALTGESLPRDVNVSEYILSGTINLGAVVEASVEKTFANSTISKVLQLIEESSNRKPAAEKFITKFAKYYTPAVVVLAILVGIVTPLIFGDFEKWFQRGLIFLVISCPCALVLSIPLTFFSSIGAASKKGILIKGGNYLDNLQHVTAVAFDKTGTLTTGKFAIKEILPIPTVSKENLLYCAAVGEFYSTHPIGKCILNENRLLIEPNKIKNHQEISGKGIKVTYDNTSIILGNYNFLKEENITVEEANSIYTTIYVAKNGEYIGALTIGDEIKKESKETIQRLKRMGITSYMLSGDKKALAMEIGSELGLPKENIYSELLPADKVTVFKKLMENSPNSTMFVGDGINDAPAIALSSIGVAMGGIGSDLAIEVADVVIINDSICKIADAIQLSKRNKRVLYENIALALGVKVIVMILGVFGFANLWLAIFADVGVSLIALLNATKLLKSKQTE